MSKDIKENILAALKNYRDCWYALASLDSYYLLGKVEAMDIAIKIVESELEKAESEVEGE